MIENEANRLRELTDDYYHGLLDWEAYRKERGRLLDGLLHLEVEDEITQDDPNVAEASSLRTDDLPSAEEVAPIPSEIPVSAVTVGEEKAPSRLTERVAVVGFSLTGLVGVILLGLLLWPSQDSDTSVNLAEDEGLNATRTRGSELPGTELIREQMSVAEWDSETVSRFLLQWDALTLDQRDRLRKSEQFRGFVAEIRNRIRVDRAIGAPAFRDGLSLSEALSIELDLGLVTRNILEAEVRTLHEAEDESKVEPPPDDTLAAAELGEMPGTVDSAQANPTGLERPDTQPMLEAATELVPEVGQPEVTIASIAEDVATPENVITNVTDGVASPGLTEILFPSDQACGADRLNFRSATCWDMIEADVTGPLMRVVPAGEFIMGEDADDSASPAHKQTIAQPFAIGMFEVSVGDYWKFCLDIEAACPERRWSGDLYPIVDVSWMDASRYTKWLSRKTGARYRLPTEAEWEYAARAGTTTKYPFGNTIQATDARFDLGSYKIGPLPADDRTTRPNEFHLLHVAGNVREWTGDVWRANYNSDAEDGTRALRGGSYADPPERLRSAAREGAAEQYSDARTGFRLARDL